MRSTTSHQFSQVPRADIERSSFDRSHGLKTAFDAGKLIPVYVDEALPGDTFNLNMTAFARMATPIYPIMDNAVMDTHFFAVPIRLIWDNWQKFNGEQLNPDDSVDFTIPQMTRQISANSLEDYMGIPPATDAVTFNTLHSRAYNLIWNEWFRDQNLQDRVPERKGDAGDLDADYQILPRGKRHDYFTSCLPWPQKGDAVQLPTLGQTSVTTTLSPTTDYIRTDMGVMLKLENNPTVRLQGPSESAGYTRLIDPLPIDATSVVDSTSGGTINDLRRAFQIQKLLERDARGGTRYTEIVKAHFGVTSPDSRLQRPEYLGGSSSNLNIEPIEQTASTDTTSPQGNLAAIGTIRATNQGFSKSFTEHCVLIGMVSVRADLTYQQGLNRMFSRQTRYDYYWPALAHIGEQAVYEREIFYTSDDNTGDDIFGYQERYAEYRFKPSQITGIFRSDHPQSLDPWHLAQDFATAPQLNSDFIEEKPPFDRVIAVPSEPHFIFDSYIKLKCARPIPLYGTPGQMDRF